MVLALSWESIFGKVLSFSFYRVVCLHIDRSHQSQEKKMTDTKTKILDVAERMTQNKGFNGFSYLDLAAEVGVKTSSIHYHFKAKADLALALVERTHAAHLAAFSRLDVEVPQPQQRLAAMVGVFEGYVIANRFCLCGMLSAELQSVSPVVRGKLRTYFDDMRFWVAKQLEEMGIRDSTKRSLSFVSALEGSLLLARLNGDAALVGNAMEQVTNP